LWQNGNHDARKYRCHGYEQYPKAVVSAARREFLNRQRHSPIQVEAMEKNGTPEDEWSGPKMQAMTDLFRIIGSELHGTDFRWSEFNKNAWISYLNLKESEGGPLCSR
jgi:hypothetical protein